MDNTELLSKTLLDGLLEFEQEHKPQLFSQVRSVLMKHTFVGSELGLCEKRRVSSQDIERSYELMKALPISRANDLEASQEKIFERLNVSLGNQHKYRFVLKQFINWLVAKGWLSEQADSIATEKVYRFSGKKHEKIKRKRLTKRGRTESYTLSFEPSDYATAEGTEAELRRIEAEFKEFKSYLEEKGFKEYTMEMREKVTKEFLGWLYKHKQVPLKEISLSSMVKFTKVQVSIRDFEDITSFEREKEIIKLRNQEAVKETEKLLEEFLNRPEKPLKPSTKEMYTETALTVAKFLYRDETDESEYRHCEDIPVVMALKKMRNNYRSEVKKTPRAVPYKEKSVPWETAYEVLERTRLEALLTHTEYKNKDGQVKRRKRPQKAIAGSFMKFLILSMFITIPPDRLDTCRKQKIGKTFKHGIWEENIFTPIEKMEQPSQAQFYIHLLPEDYKTSDTYGEWLAPLYNPEFSDGTTLYQYFEAWIYGCTEDNPLKKLLNLDNGQPLRSVLNPKDHDYLFFGIVTKKPMSRNSLSSVVCHLFERMTGKPVRPQTLRNMFRTYVDELGISEEESKSIAFWMKHSEQMAQKYSRQSHRSKLAPGEALMEEINREFFS